MANFPSLLSTAFETWGKGAAAIPKTFAASGSILKFAVPAPRRAAAAPMASDLAIMVESEIIPRLMLAHRDAPAVAQKAPSSSAPIGEDATEAFARMVLSQESESLMVHVGTLLQNGLSMEAIYVDLLAPAARLLGDYWNEDRISFTDVTIGLGRLQQVVRTLGWTNPYSIEDDEDHSARSAYFVPAAGEQHTFGLFIIEDFFRRAGWRTWIETSSEEDAVVDTVRTHWFDLLGLSASREAQIRDVAATIQAVRRASRNPDLFVLVGGRLFMERPDLVSAVGADSTAPSGGEALLVADKAVMRLASSL